MWDRLMLVAAVVLLFVLSGDRPAMGSIETWWQVIPAYDGSDPWIIDGPLYVGRSSFGDMGVTAGGRVSNTQGFVGDQQWVTGGVTVSGAGSTWTNSSTLYIGRYGTGHLEIWNGGRVFSRAGRVGHESAGSGLVQIGGSGSTWTNDVGGLIIGNHGGGSLNIYDGGRVTSAAQGSIGNLSGSRGDVLITGAGSKWTNTRALTVGGSGRGQLTIQGGASASSIHGYIGTFSAGNGDVTVVGPGSAWTNSGELLVGRFGVGTLMIETGGSVTSTDSAIGLGSSFTNPSAQGVVTVRGEGSNWTSNGELVVGGWGAAEGLLLIEDGGNVSAADGYIGRHSGSTGSVTVTGPHSVWSSSGNLVVGGDDDEAGGDGSINIQDGATLEVGKMLTIRESGTITIAGGQLTTGHFINEGEFNYRDGTLILHGGTFEHTAIPSDLELDGYAASAEVALRLNNGATTRNIADLTVGLTGRGTLMIEGGSNVVSEGGHIGRSSGSAGSVFVSGVMSTWANSGSIVIGGSGAGTLEMGAEAAVSNTDGYIGKAVGSNGAVMVMNAGTTWSNSGVLEIGGAGNGSLLVGARGAVSSDGGVVGSSVTGSGIVTVTGPGSSWNNSGSVTIGEFGTGVLAIEDGGLVSNSDARIGFRRNSSGSVTVTGSGSTWSNSGGLDVGGSGTGTLRIGPGALVSVAEGLSIRSGGMVVFSLGVGPGDGHGRLEVGGNASLGGKLSVELAEGFVPAAGAEFVTITFDSRTGRFNEVVVSGLSSDAPAAVVPVYGDTDLTLVAALWGDANLDGRVDIADLGVLAANWQATGTTWEQGDFNQDGVVNIADLGILAGNWQAGVEEGATMNFAEALGVFDVFEGMVIPEPASMSFLALMGLGLLSRRRIRRPCCWC